MRKLRRLEKLSKSLLIKIYRQRKKLYENVTDFIVYTDEKTPIQVAREIEKWLK